MLFEAFVAMLLSDPAPGSPAPAAPVAAASCPEGTRLVEGVHHEQVQRLCTDFRGAHCFSFLPGFVAFEMRETPIRACMDRYEWPNREGEKPEVMMYFTEAEAACRSAGKRMCTEFEWETACEGPEALPLPYGWSVDPAACNTSKTYRPVSEARLLSDDPRVRDAETRRAWQGEQSGARPRCVSPFGVADLVGNVEEWVATSRAEWAYRSALKGGFWSKPWAGCRGTNDSHGPLFRFYEVGFRCCADPAGAPAR